MTQVLKKAAIVAGAAAGLLALAPVANADSADNDGINILNDNNISAVPIQACGNNIAVAGAVVPIASPQLNQCVNAPIIDHPKG
ncbi:hypothetical protein [Saccharopolyspora phatthalungensis]|uniref:hypothetical protein n=1 Tax=Saccharopolyspora phatthalungensis TaxID=664693 RepID=UPI0028AA78D9|nr:hypothetical protein [Saccharopolyspora phatthalungensis]